jgi:hypothetical protein
MGMATPVCHTATTRVARMVQMTLSCFRLVPHYARGYHSLDIVLACGSRIHGQ